MTWPSTTTSPVLLNSGSSVAFSRSRRISTLVRRSTKCSVSRSCKASDSRSSTPRVTPASVAGPVTGSRRSEILAARPRSANIVNDLYSTTPRRRRRRPHQRHMAVRDLIDCACKALVEVSTTMTAHRDPDDSLGPDPPPPTSSPLDLQPLHRSPIMTATAYAGPRPAGPSI